jgi:hypothetical protein
MREDNPRKTRVQPWQIAKAKARGTARAREAAMRLYAPTAGEARDECGVKLQSGGRGRDRPINNAQTLGRPMTEDRAAPATRPDELPTPSPSDLSHDPPPHGSMRHRNASHPVQGNQGVPAARGIPSAKEQIMSKSVEKKPERPQPNVSHANTLTKLTIGTVCGIIPEMRRGDGQVWKAEFYCHVMGSEEVTQRPADAQVWYGPYTKWLGEFAAINKETGEIFTSNVAILPGIAHEKIKAALGIAANYNDGRPQNVQLAFELGVSSEARKLGNRGYAYTLRDIVPAEYKRSVVYDMIDSAYGAAGQKQLEHADDAASEQLEAAE